MWKDGKYKKLGFLSQPVDLLEIRLAGLYELFVQFSGFGMWFHGLMYAHEL